MDQKREIIKAWEATDPRFWEVVHCAPGTCHCRDMGSPCNIIQPVFPRDKNDYIIPGGDFGPKYTEFMVRAHNTVGWWYEGLDFKEHWDALKQADAALNYPGKWRYINCFAVRKKKYQQPACWCREVMEVGRSRTASGHRDLVFPAATINLPQARLFVLVHNYINGYY